MSARSLTAERINFDRALSAKQPKPNPLTEASHAERFALTYGDEFRFDHRRNLWLAWNDGAWTEDRTGLRYARAIALARRLFLDSAREGDLAARSRMAQFAIACESRHRLDNILALVRFQPPITNSGEAWDRDPWLLNTPGSVIDLRTGIPRPARPDDHLLLRTAVAPAATADCPRWRRFLIEVFSGDEALVAWLYRFLGYALTGDTGEQLFVIGYGIGANGKSTLFGTVASVLGSYAFNLPFSAMELHARASIPNDLAALVGRRFVTASESGDAVRLNEARMKMLTGGDTVTARFLHGEFFEFRPVAKFCLFTNAKPIVRDDSLGMWRRIRLVPFLQTFEVNRTLGAELIAEGPAILRWLIDGCLAWQRDGLPTPKAVLAATKEYRTDSDQLEQFLDAKCVLGETESCRAGELFNRYREWADAEGLGPRERLNQRRFGSKIKERFDSLTDNKGVRYVGVGLS